MVRYFFVLLFEVSFFSFSQSDTAIIRKEMIQMVEQDVPRSFEHVEVLDQHAHYIHTYFRKYTDSVAFQNFNDHKDSLVYKNVIASFGTENQERIIIGAHYDVCGDQSGADDNASGVVGLLELARLLEHVDLKYRIDLVAYSLEEPPFFRSQYMGSYVHAKYLNDNKIPVYGMICLEMIGYFNDAKHSQSYPLGILRLFYGSKGDFITIVSKMGRGKFARKYKRKMKGNKHVKTKAFQAPAKLSGIDFSDHLNYWNFGYSAVMITNTGFYRNANYHKRSDELSTIDIPRMAGVIDAVFETIIKLASK